MPSKASWLLSRVELWHSIRADGLVVASGLQRSRFFVQLKLESLSAAPVDFGSSNYSIFQEIERLRPNDPKCGSVVQSDNVLCPRKRRVPPHDLALICISGQVQIGAELLDHGMTELSNVRFIAAVLPYVRADSGAHEQEDEDTKRKK